MNRQRAKQSRLRHRLALLVASAMSAATPALPGLAADDTSVLRLPISSRLTAQPPVASLRVSARRLPEDDSAGDSVATATELAANNSPDTPSPANTAGQSSVDPSTTPPASVAAQSPDGTATQSSAVIAVDSPVGIGVGSPSSAAANLAETSPEANSGTNTRFGSGTATAKATDTATEEQSVLRSQPPERLPKVTSFDAATQPSPPVRVRATPVRLPPVESPDTLTYGAFQRSPVRIGSESIPAPAVGGGPDRGDSRSPVPAPYRLPPTQASPTRSPSTRTPISGFTAGLSSSSLGGPQPGVSPVPEAESSD